MNPNSLVYTEDMEKVPLDEFTVMLNKFPEESFIGKDQEQINQFKMFELRKLFEAELAMAEYKWIPQAVEAFVRSRQSDFTIAFGDINGIHLDSKHGDIEILVSAETKGAFRIELKNLANFSVELMLDQLDKENELPALNYSEAMQTAVAELSDDAKYRWNLITRAARHATNGGNSKIRVAPVANNLGIFGSLNGVGIYLDSMDKRKFSALKVTNQDLPFTEREKKLLDLAIGTADFGEFYDDYGQIVSSFYNIKNEILKYLKISNKKDTTAEILKELIRYRLRKTFTPESDYHKGKRIQELLDNLVRIEGAATEIKDDVTREIFKAKAHYQQKRPFEYNDEESSENIQSMKKHLAEQIRVLQEIEEFFRTNTDFVQKTLPNPEEFKARELKKGTPEYLAEMNTENFKRAKDKFDELLKKPALSNKGKKLLEEGI
ncbi:MAG: hypothetical protein PHU71_02030 [Candidatus Gracilibacteria bacterium]|nr:hypothetical protein [Candidatus Gracilibacteria bacterium]